MKTTEADFWRVLGECKGMGWTVSSDDEIRSGCHCPITAVCERVTGQVYDDDSVVSAIHRLGIEEEFADSIIAVADAEFDEDVNYHRLRSRLLRTLGLEERT